MERAVLTYEQARLLKAGDKLYLRRNGGEITVRHFNEITRAITFVLSQGVVVMTPDQYHLWTVTPPVMAPEVMNGLKRQSAGTGSKARRSKRTS